MKVGHGYLIRASPNEGFVEAWSAWHLPFEPRLPAQKEFRGHLRDDVISLGASDALQASLISTHVVAGLDLENVLFYNVGTSVFRKLTRRALRFERVAPPPPVAPLLLDFAARHYVRYQIQETLKDIHPYVLPLAGSQVNCREVRELKNVAGLWRSFKEAMGTGSPAKLSGHPFALKIEISASAWPQLVLVEVMKPVIDAFISALHCYEGKHLDVVVGRLCKGLETSPDHVRQLLLEASKAVLGPRAVPHLRGEGLQWSPADDQLVRCELLLQDSGEKDAIRISVSAFAAEATP